MKNRQRLLPFLLLFFYSTSFAQPQPIVFKALAPVATELYNLDEAGLLAISNDHELQLWDTRNKAYFGSIPILPAEAVTCKIIAVEYLAGENQLAVVWQEKQVTGKDSLYKRFLEVFDLASFQHIKRDTSGMAALIKYKLGRKVSLPALKEEKHIVHYWFNQQKNILYTLGDNGMIWIYQNQQTNRLPSGIKAADLFVATADGRYIFIADKTTNTLQRLEPSTNEKKTVLKFIPNNTCAQEWAKGGEPVKTFSVTYSPSSNAFYSLDSVNRFLSYYIEKDKAERDYLPIPNEIQAVGLSQARDSNLIFIAESKEGGCRRIIASIDRETGITNIISTGTPSHINAAFSTGQDQKIRMLVSGLYEQEIDLSTLQDKTITYLADPEERSQMLYSGLSENRYIHVFNSGEGKKKVKIFRTGFTSNENTQLQYETELRINNNEELAAVATLKKWYVTTTKFPRGQTSTGLFFVYDSAGKKIFQTGLRSLPLQILSYYPNQQQIFSKREEFMMIKEVLGNHGTYDSIRLRVFSTSDFSLIGDLTYIEGADHFTHLRQTASFSDSSHCLFITRLEKKGNGYINVFEQYKINKTSLQRLKQLELCADPGACQVPLYIKNLKVTTDDKVFVWTGKTSAYQSHPPLNVIMGQPAEANQQPWALYLPIFPEVQGVLPLSHSLGIHYLDRIQFYKWNQAGPENYLTALPYMNDNNVGITTLFVSAEPDNSMVYYEKNDIDECISFRVNKNSFRRPLFDINYNRPDKIMAKIPGHDSTTRDLFHKAVLKRIERLQPPPKVVDVKDLPVLTLKKTVQGVPFRLTAKAQSRFPVTRFLLKINGNVREIKAVANKEGDYDFTFDLIPGENVMEITAFTANGLQGLPLRITYTPTATNEKPSLHVLVISVGNYINPANNLPFAVKDGRDIAHLLKHQLTDTLYKSIQVDTIFNEAVSEAAIQQWLAKLNIRSAADQVIVFYSGHGILNKDHNLELAVSSTDLSQPDGQNISFQKLLAKMDALPNQFKLLLIDACHSGDLDKSEISRKSKTPGEDLSTVGKTKGGSVENTSGESSTFEKMQQLFSFSEKGNGTVVFSASGGMQSAFEAATYQNGFFTYAIKEAIAEKKASEDYLKTVSLNQLIKYVTQRVTTISHGLQIPNLRIKNTELKWRLR